MSLFTHEQESRQTAVRKKVWSCARRPCQDRRLGELEAMSGSFRFTKASLASLCVSAVQWLREHRVCLLLFNTSGRLENLRPTDTSHTEDQLQSMPSPGPSVAKPPGLSPTAGDGRVHSTESGGCIQTVFDAPEELPSPESRRDDRHLPADPEWRTITVEQLPLPLLQHTALLAVLRTRSEWKQHRIEIKRRQRKKSSDFYDVECMDAIDCRMRWRAFYLLTPGIHPAGTLVVQACGEHAHHQARAVTTLFTPEQLEVARAYFDGGGRSLPGLKLAFSSAQISETSLPTPQQMSSWLKRTKASAQTAQKQHDRVAGLVQLQLSSIPRAMPQDLVTLFLLDEPILSEKEVCILFSCRAAIEQLSRYEDAVLCLTVDTKMKVACHGYGVATVGMLTKDGLRKTTLSRSPQGERTQGFALTSHTVPIAQALIHQETTPNYTRLFRRVDALWQDSASPRRPPLSDLPIQVHKDFNPAIEAARLDCFPRSRGCDDFFHWTQKQHTTMASKCQQMELKRGKWVKKNLQWTLATVRLLRILPTLRLFSHVWTGFLARLMAEKEPQLVEWLRSYERPVPYQLQQRTASDAGAYTYVSFWSGLEGSIPGSGSGSQPAEALHAPWQQHLEALGGKGSVDHVLAVMQNLYTEHWQKWFNWNDNTPLRFLCEDCMPRTHSTCHDFHMFSSKVCFRIEKFYK